MAAVTAVVPAGTEALIDTTPAMVTEAVEVDAASAPLVAATWPRMAVMRELASSCASLTLGAREMEASTEADCGANGGGKGDGGGGCGPGDGGGGDGGRAGDGRLSDDSTGSMPGSSRGGG